MTSEQEAELAQRRLRNAIACDGGKMQLTDEEREALEQCASDYEDSAALCYERMHHVEAAKRMKRAMILRGLLERLK